MAITHSFIPVIYIEPLQETYSEVLPIPLRLKYNIMSRTNKF